MEVYSIRLHCGRDKCWAKRARWNKSSVYGIVLQLCANEKIGTSYQTSGECVCPCVVACVCVCACAKEAENPKMASDKYNDTHVLRLFWPHIKSKQAKALM